MPSFGQSEPRVEWPGILAIDAWKRRGTSTPGGWSRMGVNPERCRNPFCSHGRVSRAASCKDICARLTDCTNSGGGMREGGQDLWGRVVLLYSTRLVAILKANNSDTMICGVG
eukprot:759718-Hanusia_phi.AAC.2